MLAPQREPVVLRPMGLPPIKTTIDNKWAFIFFRFCAERHQMTERRLAGVARDKLTADEAMQGVHIGNVFRQLDPSSHHMSENIIGKGDQSVEEVCFRVFLYCSFYTNATWELLCKAAGGIPTWQNFENCDMAKMEEALHERSIMQSNKIYYGGFQIVPPTIYFTDNRNKSATEPDGKTMYHYAASLRLVLAIMEMGVPQKLLECKYAMDASYLLQTLPAFGGFLSLNVLCYLNESASPHFNWHYRDFATCGPGARAYLQRMFGKESINGVAAENAGLKWLKDNQWRYWARLGLDPPHAWQDLAPGMRVLDFENALCWCHRYVASYTAKGHRSFADAPWPDYDPTITEVCGPSAWCLEEKHIGTEQADDCLGPLYGENDLYEVESVVARSGPWYRVRWKGWPPEEDTWEFEQNLQEDAADALKEWVDWEANVATTIQAVKHQPYTKLPAPGIVPKVETARPKRKRAAVQRYAARYLDLEAEEVRDEVQVEEPSGRGRRKRHAAQPGVGHGLYDLEAEEALPGEEDDFDDQHDDEYEEDFEAGFEEPPAYSPPEPKRSVSQAIPPGTYRSVGCGPVTYRSVGCQTEDQPLRVITGKRRKVEEL